MSASDDECGWPAFAKAHGSLLTGRAELLAVFSPCRKYRYYLKREWNPQLPYVAFIGLNPSTADETQDDPTIRRCIGFAKAWGFGGLRMLNLFAYRDTSPKGMLSQSDPIGQENNPYIQEVCQRAGLVLAAWGAHGTHLKRDAEVRAMVLNLHYLRLTKDGCPGHPLYLPANLTPVLWVAA